MERKRGIKLSKDQIKRAKSFLRFLRPYKGYFILGFVFLILGSLTAMLFPFLLGKLLGNNDGQLLVSESLSEVFNNPKYVVISLVAVFVAQALFAFFRVYLFGIVTENALNDLRQESFKHLVLSPITFFNKNKVGELTSRIATDINLLEETLNTTIAEFVRQIIIVLLSLVALFIFAPNLSLIMLLTIPVVTVGAILFGSFIKKLSKKTQDSAAESNNILSEALSGITNVKSFANEAFEILRYRKAAEQIKVNALKGVKWRGVFISFIIVAMFSAIVFILWQGMELVSAKKMSSETFNTFIILTIYVGSGIGSIPNMFARIQKALGATESLMGILEEETEEIDLSKEKKRIVDGNLRFDQISFHYETRPDVEVLKNISFTAKKGEKVALVGSSGAGKSTIASLILKLYEPVSGKILFDEIDSANYGLTELRDQMAVVPQDVILFNGTIKENILYGNTASTEEEIIQAAKDANAHDFIMSFPDGYETIVGDRGIQLSGGQRQRVAIARAILKNPAILILDEATSSLDSESEKLVQEALDRLMENRTSIVIAHRLSTIKQFDKILVFNQGELIERGTHDELMEIDKGVYKNLASIQFA